MISKLNQVIIQSGQKSAILRFLRDLTQYLEASIIQNSSETRLVISKLVGWSNEPKHAEVRREAAASIRSLFSLNPAQVRLFFENFIFIKHFILIVSNLNRQADLTC